MAAHGIAVLDRAQLVGRAHPDDTRDSGVGYVWIDHRMFSDTGARFEIEQGDERFEFEPLGAPSFEEIEWNAKTGAVVGRVGKGIAAFDPIANRPLYHDRLEDLPDGRLSWSPGGRWCALLLDGQEIRLLDARSGKALSSFSPLPRRSPPACRTTIRMDTVRASDFPGISCGWVFAGEPEVCCAGRDRRHGL